MERESQEALGYICILHTTSHLMVIKPILIGKVTEDQRSCVLYPKSAKRELLNSESDSKFIRFQMYSGH